MRIGLDIAILILSLKSGVLNDFQHHWGYIVETALTLSAIVCGHCFYQLDLTHHGRPICGTLFCCASISATSSQHTHRKKSSCYVVGLITHFCHPRTRNVVNSIILFTIGMTFTTCPLFQAC
jgi:hypothetical protein